MYVVGSKVRYHHSPEPDHVEEMEAWDGECGIVRKKTSIRHHPHYLVQFEDDQWYCREDSLTLVNPVTITVTRKQ